MHALGNGGGAIYDWFASLSARLRRVRVVCGDWSRVCGGNWQDYRGVCGIFFDPPYAGTGRNIDLYHHDSTTIFQDVQNWALQRGDKETYRIVIAGYEEHAELLKHGWTSRAWKASGGYSHITRSGKPNENCRREVLYFSPHCLRGDEATQETLAL